MGSIPLPALAINQQQPSPLDEVARVFQIQGMQQQMQGQQTQNQLAQLNLQQAQRAQADDTKWRAALTDPSFDGTPSKLLDLGLKQGVGPQSWMNMGAGLTAMQTGLAKLGSDQLKNASDVADHFGDQLSSVQSAKPADRLAAQQQAKQSSLAWINGTPGLSPVMKQNLLQQVSQVPDDVPLNDDDLQLAIARNKGESGLISDALKKAQANEANAKAASEQTTAGLNQIKLNLAKNSKPGDFDAQIDQIAGPNSPLGAQAKAMVNGALSRGDVDGAKQALDQTFQRVGSEQQAGLNRQAEASQQALNRQAMFSNENQKAGLSQLDKMFTDPQHGYTQFLAQAQSTKNDIAKAQNGDELAASLAPLMTALGVTSFAGLHRINQTEVNSAGPQVGSLYRQLNAMLSKAGSGSLPADTTKRIGKLIDGLIDAKHASLIQGAQLASKQ